MDADLNLIEALLSRLAGILEDASTAAASAEAVRDRSVVDRLRRDLNAAGAMVAVIEVLQRE